MNPARWLAAHAAGSRRGVAALGALFIAAIVGLAAFDIVRSYRTAVDDTGRELDAEARVIAEQAARSIQAIDVVLRHLAEQHRRGNLARLGPAELHALLREQSVGLVQADGLALHDAQGAALALSWLEPPLPEASNASDRAAFQTIRETELKQSFVGEALKSRDGSVHFFPIARRLTTANGRFAGTVTARGRIDYFQHFYRDARPDAATVINLMHRAGTLLARYPEAPSALGQPLPLLAELLAASANGTRPLRAVSPIDGVERFGAVQAVPDYPLLVVVTRDTAAALGSWRASAIGSGLRTLALAAMALLLLAVVLRQLRRIDSTVASLEVSEERYALAAAGADDGIWDWDLAAGTAYESARARELQGLPPGPETQPLAELQGLLTYHPDDAERRRETMQAHLDGKTPAYEIDYRVRHPDGIYRWIRVRALCIRDARGTPCRIAGSVSDIDAAKRVEEALRESERRFAVAVAGSDDGIWEWDYETGTAFASHRGREITGLPPGPEMQSIASWFEQMEARLHPDDVQRRKDALEAHLAGRAPAYEGEFRVRAEGGGYRWIRVHGMCMRDAGGRVQAIAGSVSDIDSRKRSEEALRVSEERYAIATTGSHEGHWVWSLADNQVFVSGLLAEIFDLDPGQQITSLDEFFRKVPILREDYARVEQAVRDHIDGRTPRLDIEYRILRRGEIRWVANRAMLFRDAQGRAERMAGATVDVTERHAAEAALRESEERFQLAIAGSNDGILDWDMVHDRFFTSERAMKIAGVEATGQVRTRAEWAALLHVHPDDKARHDEDFRRHLRGETEVRIGDYRVRHPDGVYRWVRVRGMAVRDAQDRPIRWAGSVSDIDEQKRTEEALRRSEERYALAMTASNEGHWLWDMPARQIYISAKHAEILGIEGGAQTLSESAYFESLPLHPDDRERVHRNRADHVAGRIPRLDHEFRVVMPDSGEVRWLHTRAQCFRDADGTPLRMAGSTVDATPRKSAEIALRVSQQRFADAVAGSDDGIWDWDYTTGMAFLSQRGRSLVGLPPGPEVMTIAETMETVGRQLHPEDAERRAAAIADHLAGRTPAYVGDYRARQPDGSWRWVHIHGRCVRDGEGRVLRLAGSSSDIDDRKRAEDALRESEERYALAMTGSRGGHWVWDSATDHLFVSPAFNELCGLPADTPPASRTEYLRRVAIHPDDLAVVRQGFDAQVHGDAARTDYECRILLPDGSVRWILNRSQRFAGTNGSGVRVAGVSVDITERKLADAERGRLERQLRQAQKLEAIGTLAGGIAHDFNNILSAILGYGELAQKDAAEGTALRRHVDASLAAGQRAKSLVERILAFSRSGMAERVPVHVQSVVTEALDGIVAALPSDVRLLRRLEAGDAGVLGDPTQIHQVVMNLCANAVQAMRSDGTIEVGVDLCRLEQPTMVSTCTLPPGRYVRLAVRDSGVGIAPAVLERIFDPFFTTKEVGVGTGLGLSLVHGIVGDLGGGIAVESRLGDGALFTVWLPAQSYVAAPAPAEEAVAFGQGETVLLVDDEEALVRLGEETLAELGYEPVGFSSSAAALEAFRADPDRFDLLLSDETMPGLTGSELVAEVRRIRPALPVVLMSGYVNAALAQRAREAGVAEILAKPLAARDIARSLAAALRAPRLADGRELHDA